MKTRSDETVRRMVCRGGIAAVMFIVFAGCGGETTNKQGPNTGNSNSSSEETNKNVNFDADVGALDQTKVNRALDRASTKLTDCFTQGLKRVPFMGGNIKFAMRINTEGKVNVAYMKESTLGDRVTESCILNALRASSWPAPVGGREGLAEGGFGFDPSPDERAPVELDAEKLGKELPKAQAAIGTCRSAAGAGPVTVTMYVGTDGKPLSVGVSTADAKGESAADCIVDAVKGMTFASPGSYAAKVAIESN
ncbi:MAG TPA: AgmX/PglI C-terminal domain-containing protein [Polyangium sp.]|nr:AgmX/PglI C-terminal domain-containing protein [Polyangium sp.]